MTFAILHAIPLLAVWLVVNLVAEIRAASVYVPEAEAEPLPERRPAEPDLMDVEQFFAALPALPMPECGVAARWKTEGRRPK